MRELPRGRQPITTNTIFIKDKPQWLARAWQRITEEVGEGRQAYVVASRIDEDDKSPEQDAGPPAETVVNLFQHLGHGPLAGLRLGLMHGRLAPDEKDAVMAAFNSDDWWFHSAMRGQLVWIGYGLDATWNLRLAAFHERRDGRDATVPGHGERHRSPEPAQGLRRDRGRP